MINKKYSIKMLAKNILSLSLIALAAVSCADTENNASFIDYEQILLDRWVEANRPSLNKVQDGLYMEYFKEDPDKAIESVSDKAFYKVDVAAKTLEGDYVFNMSPIMADTLGTFSYFCHYIPMYIEAKHASRYLSDAQSIALSEMNIGDSVEIVAKSDFIKNGAVFTGTPATGFQGNVGYKSGKSGIVNMKLIDVIDNPTTYERNSVFDYATDVLGLAKADSLEDVSLQYMKTLEQGSTYILDDKDTVDFEYVGKFLDGFIFDTNIKAVADSANITNSDTTVYRLKTLTIGSENTSYIDGFYECIKNMNWEEKVVTVFTSSLGYEAIGNSSSSTIIYPYTPLIFEIKVVNVRPYYE